MNLVPYFPGCEKMNQVPYYGGGTSFRMIARK
jgi:hypothetical protein